MEFAIAIFAALLGALLTYLAQNYFAMQSQDAQCIDDHILEIRNIENYALEYWLTDPKENPVADAVLASKVQGAMTVSSCFNVEARRLLGALHQEYIELDQWIFDAATGGDFLGNSRTIDGNRAIEIMSACNNMRALLRRSRRRLYWAR